MKQQGTKGGVFVFLIVIAALIALVGWMINSRSGKSDTAKDQTTSSSTSTKSVKADKSDWQAVMLTGSDQFYVGKVSNMNDPFVLVKEAYVIRTSTTDNKPTLNVFRVSEGAHGPMNDIRISQSAILLIEDLREDSDVVKLINDYDAQKKAQQTSTDSTPKP